MKNPDSRGKYDLRRRAFLFSTLCENVIPWARLNQLCKLFITLLVRETWAGAWGMKNYSLQYLSSKLDWEVRSVPYIPQKEKQLASSKNRREQHFQSADQHIQSALSDQHHIWLKGTTSVADLGTGSLDMAEPNSLRIAVCRLWCSQASSSCQLEKPYKVIGKR